ncbi:hypothetical protein OsJ_22213 [Oryza sativa Japonica Group]|uniref:Uncharacterized protein n=1 Tax=Oryza sativa subsp. japonica TaxID=39947 RepID=B9FQA4_ORYSJ|nr:hypothetical protein OsJ_22213 [Oryza sativa Japonica Group]
MSSLPGVAAPHQRAAPTSSAETTKERDTHHEKQSGPKKAKASPNTISSQGGASQLDVRAAAAPSSSRPPRRHSLYRHRCDPARTDADAATGASEPPLPAHRDAAPACHHLRVVSSPGADLPSTPRPRGEPLLPTAKPPLPATGLRTLSSPGVNLSPAATSQRLARPGSGREPGPPVTGASPACARTSSSSHVATSAASSALLVERAPPSRRHRLRRPIQPCGDRIRSYRRRIWPPATAAPARPLSGHGIAPAAAPARGGREPRRRCHCVPPALPAGARAAARWRGEEEEVGGGALA